MLEKRRKKLKKEAKNNGGKKTKDGWLVGKKYEEIKKHVVAKV